MSGILSKGIKLAYKTGEGSEFVELTDLQEIPDLGGTSEAVEVTTLADAAHMYIDGLINYGDSLEFKFLYETEQFSSLGAIKSVASWQVTLPDQAICTFSGSCSVKLDGVGINSPLTYTLAIKPNSEMKWA
jgi:hypothetical protein